MAKFIIPMEAWFFIIGALLVYRGFKPPEGAVLGATLWCIAAAVHIIIGYGVEWLIS